MHWPTREELCKEILRIGGNKVVMRSKPVIWFSLVSLGIIGSQKSGLTKYGRQIYFKLLRGEDCPEVRLPACLPPSSRRKSQDV